MTTLHMTALSTLFTVEKFWIEENQKTVNHKLTVCEKWIQ